MNTNENNLKENNYLKKFLLFIIGVAIILASLKVSTKPSEPSDLFKEEIESEELLNQLDSDSEEEVIGYNLENVFNEQTEDEGLIKESFEILQFIRTL